MNRVRERRKQLRLAQQALGVAARVSPSILVSIERYDYRPTKEVQQRLADALGCTIEQLWPTGGDDADHPQI